MLYLVLCADFLPSSLNLVGKKIFPDTEAERADLCADSSKYTVGGEPGIQTSNLLTTRRPTLPPEPQLPADDSIPFLFKVDIVHDGTKKEQIN